LAQERVLIRLRYQIKTFGSMILPLIPGRKRPILAEQPEKQQLGFPSMERVISGQEMMVMPKKIFGNSTRKLISL
jgi:hypothetical protein